MADGQVLIEITADNRDVKQTLRDTTNELTSAGQKWEKQGDAMSGVFKKIAGSITAAGIGKALLDIGKDAVEAASKLEEVQNVVDVTFGESSKQIDRWAKDAIRQFGLTETQAKQFTSTLGAMMKSSGVSGNEIVKMSTDLSGLAADMASFYNLDFETAFQKIRSGISGETEPLKQLGINMSVVNLEAFAMTQGITKSFQEMSQGEQVMLRYQYIMQATADAQNDFARTSNGFANATRRLESNLDSLKTKLGGPLMEGFNRVLGKINEVVDAITGDTGQRTILDRFTEIDQEKESKLAEVRNTAQTARELVGILEGLENDGFHVTAMTEFARGANMLDSSSPANWRNVLTALKNNISGVEAVWDENEPGKNIEDLAQALSGLNGGTSKAQAWQIMLHALSDNAEGIAQMSGMSTSDVRALLDKFAADAGKIDENDAEAWDRLFTSFARSFPSIITSTTLRAMGQNIRGVAEGAKILDSTSPSNWRDLLSAIQNNMGGVEAIWDETDPGKNVNDLAQALSGLSTNLTKAQAWQMMLQALSDNADGIARMSGMSTGDVRALLDRFAADAGMINEDDAEAWDLLFTTFATSFPSIITSTTLRALGQNIGGIATNANGLRASSQANWEKFAQACQSIDGLTNIWTGSADGVEGLAQALSNRGITQSRAQAWRTMTDALKENIGIISEIHGANEADTTTWLESLADAAMQLSPENAEAWDTLFGWLVQGLPGLSQTPEGQALINALNGASELTNGGPGHQTTQASDEAVQIMEMLGIATDGVNDKQQLWLATCRELVKQIPTLSRIINTETGEIIGGTQAVKDYVDAWEAQSVREIYINALRQKMSELESEMYASRSNATVARVTARSLIGDTMKYRPSAIVAEQEIATDDYLDRLRERARSLFEAGVSVREIQSVIDSGDPTIARLTESGVGSDLSLIGMTSNGLGEPQKKVAKDYVQAIWDEWYGETVIPEAQREFAAEVQRVTEEGIATMDDLVDKYGEVGDAAEDAASAQSQLSDDQKKSWEDAIDAAIKAIEAVKAYEEQMISAARSTLRGWGNVFDEVQTKDEKTLHDIEESLKDFEGDKTAEFNVRVGTSDIVSAQNMLANLQNRAARYREYGNTLQALQNMGYSDDVLAQFANGDLNNLDYMRQLMRAGGNSEYVTQVNEAFQQMKETENDLAEFLAEQGRKTDEGYQKVVDAAEQAMNAFDSMTATDAPAIAIGETIDNVIKTIETKYPVLQNKLHLLQNAVWSLQYFGNRDVEGQWFNYYSRQGVTGGHRSVAGGSVVGSGYSFTFNGSHADGLGFVPFDGYIAQLHRGESVLTAEEAQIWREFRSGIDANSLAGAIWDNSPDLGGNVYLNGEIVGRIMSGAQADSYRQLERSGWRG